MAEFLNEARSTALLAEAGIPMGAVRTATTRQEALAMADQIGKPLVMKILSPDILHKSDAGGVFVDVAPHRAPEVFDTILTNAGTYAPGAKIDGVLMREMLPQGLEMVLGLKRDPQFGPVVMAGMGGVYLEVFRDVTLRLAPVDLAVANEMISELRANAIIEGKRGAVYDKQALAAAIVAVSRLAESDVAELDINPFFLYKEGKGGIGADALVRLQREEMPE